MATFCDRYGPIFDKYDDLLMGEIGAGELFNLYQDVRSPGIRHAQIEASLEHVYGEKNSTLERTDFEEMLRELDRRFFLLKDLVWEYNVLAKANGLISEPDARLLFRSTHESKFSPALFDKWIQSRTVRGAGISFNEIDVLLCNIPKTEDIEKETKRKISSQLSVNSFEKERRKMALLGRSATTVITDRTKAHDKKKKIEKLTYLKKLQDIKDKRSNNKQQRKTIEEGVKLAKQKEYEEEEKIRKEKEEEDERKRIEEEKEALIKRKKDKEQRQREYEEEAKRRKEKEEEDERKRIEEEKEALLRSKAEQDEAAEKEKAKEAQRLEEEKQKLLEEELKKKQEEEEANQDILNRQRSEQAEIDRKEEEKKKKEQEAADAAEADRIAFEELQKEGDRTTRNALICDKENDIAIRELKEAEEILKNAKKGGDPAKIKEASENKSKAELKVKKTKTNKTLTKAIRNRDLTELEPALKAAKAKKIAGTEPYMSEAEELIKLLYAAVNLENAARDRQIEDIESAIQKIRAGNFEVILAKELNTAEVLLKKLKRLEFLKRQVMELKQQTIAELKSFKQPPTIVKHVMTTTFLILGHNSKDLKTWNQLLVLMGKTGKEGLKRRVMGFEPDTMPYEVAEICRDILTGLDTGLVADTSAGAAAFFVWCDGMIEERLSLPVVITTELKEKRRASLKREESNSKLMKGGTVEVLSRRSRSITTPDRGKADQKARVQSKSPRVRRSIQK